MTISIKGTNSEETRMIKAIQKSLNAVSDGIIGGQTFTEMAQILSPDAFPYSTVMYNAPCIIAKNFLPFIPGKGMKNWKNSMSGSFAASGTPYSILVENGVIKRSEACHAWLGYPETVIYVYKDGTFGMDKVKDVKEIKKYKDIKYAVGGVGLINNKKDVYDPNSEGFCRINNEINYSDVLRKTTHNILGYKNGFWYGIMVRSMTGEQVKNFIRDKLKLEYAIMLDGGHISSINGAIAECQYNTSLKQNYGIQFY